MNMRIRQFIPLFALLGACAGVELDDDSVAPEGQSDAWNGYLWDHSNVLVEGGAQLDDEWAFYLSVYLYEGGRAELYYMDGVGTADAWGYRITPWTMASATSTWTGDDSEITIASLVHCTATDLEGPALDCTVGDAQMGSLTQGQHVVLTVNDSGYRPPDDPSWNEYR